MRRQWLGLAVLALPVLLVTMDLTVLFLAVPSLTADLDPSANQLLWITDVYGFLIAGALIVMGALGDRLGRRRVLLAGGALFAAASVLAAVATGPEMLIVARAVQGVAGAMLLPSAMALVFGMFPEGPRRTAALGVVMGMAALGAALGPLLGGALLSLFDWRAVFVPNVPVMAALLILGPRLVPEFRNPEAGRVDLASGALSVGGVLAAVYAIKQLAQDGLAPLPVALLGAGVLLVGAFVTRQRRLESPLVDVRLFTRAPFSAAFAATTLGMFVVYGTFFFTTQYLQIVLGLSPLEAGLWGLPPVAAMMLISTAVLPRLAARVRPGFLVAGGMVVAAGGLALLTALEPASGVGLLVAAIVVVMIGVAPATTLGVNLIVGAAPPEQAGSVSGLGQAGNELGGALGIALLGSIGTAIYRDEAPAAAGDTLGAAVAAALPSEVIGAAEAAFTSGLTVVAAIAAALLAVSSLAVAALLRGVPAPEAPAREDAGAAVPVAA
jgi:MFS transporter, DHA2 family, multidrug resistance protein